MIFITFFDTFFLHGFFMCCCIVVGSILHPFRVNFHASPHPFPHLFAPVPQRVSFGLPLPPFGIHLEPFGSHFAPNWLPLASLWLPLGPFGRPFPPFGVPFGSLHVNGTRHKRTRKRHQSCVASCCHQSNPYRIFLH